MKANELRIGNYVELEGVYSKLNNTTFKAIIDGRYNELKPIELTEEILYKLNNNQPLKIFDEVILNGVVFELKSQGLFFTGGGGCVFTDEPIKFLHELQNYVQLFSKKELEVNF